MSWSRLRSKLYELSQARRSFVDDRAFGSRELTTARVLALVTIALIVLFSLTLDGFASWGNAMALLRSIAIVGLMALGMTVVIVGGGIDLSQVVVAVISVGVAVKTMEAGTPTVLALGAGLAAAVALALANGVLVRIVAIPPLFATLASGLLFIGIARLTLLPGATIYFPRDRTGLASLGESWRGLPIALLVVAAAAIALHIFLTFTGLGQFIRAHGDNPRTAWVIGLPVTSIVMTQYAVSAATGFIAGLVMLASSGLVDLQQASSSMIFDVILIAVAGGASLSGGRGGIPGTLAATLLVGVLLNGMTIMNISSDVQTIAKGGALLIVLAADRLLNSSARTLEAG